MLRVTRRVTYCILMIGFFLSANISHADTVYYPDMEGETVHFDLISETSSSLDALFGNPTVHQDTISFPGFGFMAQAVNCDAEFLNGRLDMTIRAKPGELISSIDFSEFGTFFLHGVDSTVMSASVFNATADGVNYSGDMMFDENTAGNSSFTDWMTLVLDQPTEEVSLVFDSRLFASAGIQEAAFIDKSQINISVGTISSVPEPASASLLASGLGLILLTRRRRKFANF